MVQTTEPDILTSLLPIQVLRNMRVVDRAVVEEVMEADSKRIIDQDIRRC
jgi:hypothetical protein